MCDNTFVDLLQENNPRLEYRKGENKFGIFSRNAAGALTGRAGAPRIGGGRGAVTKYTSNAAALAPPSNSYQHPRNRNRAPGRTTEIIQHHKQQQQVQNSALDKAGYDFGVAPYAHGGGGGSTGENFTPKLGWKERKKQQTSRITNIEYDVTKYHNRHDHRNNNKNTKFDQVKKKVAKMNEEEQKIEDFKQNFEQANRNEKMRKWKK